MPAIVALAAGNFPAQRRSAAYGMIASRRCAMSGTRRLPGVSIFDMIGALLPLAGLSLLVFGS